MTKLETLPKGAGVAKFDFSKTLRNQLFSRVRVLNWITNHSESIGTYCLQLYIVVVFLAGLIVVQYGSDATVSCIHYLVCTLIVV